MVKAALDLLGRPGGRRVRLAAASSATTEERARRAARDLAARRLCTG